jgi:hypothetical protein
VSATSFGADERRFRPVGYFDLLRDLELPGCAVCRGETHSAWRYLDALLWERITDAGTRESARRTHGFCREHSFLSLAVAHELHCESGMAILFEDLLTHVIGDLEVALEESGGRGRRRKSKRDPLAPESRCRVCAIAAQTAANYLRLLATADPTSEIGSAARSGEPHLCVWHLRRGFAQTSLEDERRSFAEVFAAGTNTLHEELREFIRKRDYRFAHEGTTEREGNAWIRAVHLMVGEFLRRPHGWE